MKKKIKKLVTTGIVSLMFIGLPCKGDTGFKDNPFTITAQAAEQQSQSPRWEGQGDIWRVKDNAGGYLKNSWFQDLDSSWYMLGADGIMYSGLVTDQSTGKTYLLNTNHDGTYGRMLTVNGTYAVNGVSVYLEFNQAHDGSYGAITSDLTEARSTGIKETGLASIPTDSASGSNSVTTGVSDNTQNRVPKSPDTPDNADNTSNTDNSNTGGYYIQPEADPNDYDPEDLNIGQRFYHGDKWNSY